MEDARLAALLDRIDTLEKRVALLESGTSRLTPSRPPVIWDPPEVLASPLAVTEDTEYLLGAKVLPRVGAAVLGLMFFYLVGIAYDRGWLGPWTIWTGALLLSLGFVAFGQLRRNTREQFGDILTGTGVVGLYLDAAGGSLLQKLYPGEAMVAGFVGISLASLLYARWRGTKAFLAIGTTGGLVASLMPLDSHRPDVGAVLLFTILVAAFVVTATKRWSTESLIVWIVGLGDAAILAGNGLLRPWDAVAMGGVGVLALLAYGWSLRGDTHPVQAPPSMGGLLTLVNAAVIFAYHPRTGGAFEVMWFAVAASVAALGSSQPSRAAIFAGSIAAVTLLCPFSMNPVPGSFTLLGAGLVAALVGLRFAPRASYLLAAGQILAATCWTIAEWKLFGRWDLPFSGMLCLTGLVATVGARRVDAYAEDAFGFFAAAALGYSSYLALVDWGWITNDYAATVAFLVASLGLLVLGFVRQLRDLRMIAFGGFALTTGKLVFYDLASAPSVVRVVLLLMLGSALVGGGYWYIQRKPSAGQGS